MFDIGVLIFNFVKKECLKSIKKIVVNFYYRCKIKEMLILKMQRDVNLR